MRHLAFAAALLGLAGCLAPPSAAQRLTESAIDMNTAARFGRMDIASEHVGAKGRADFARKHAAWGGSVRIVDLDFGGFEIVKGDQADVYIDVTWLRPDETSVRVTRVAQRWQDDRGTWRLISESRKAGDVGLLGEPPPKEKPAAPTEAAPPAPLRASFQTRVIREE
jgi:hypothetical protein